MRLRVLIILLVTLLAGLIISFFLIHSQSAHLKYFNGKLREEKKESFNAIMALAGAPLESMARDYTNWDEMVDFVEHPSQEWGRTNLGGGLAAFDVNGIWVFNPSGEQVYSTFSSESGLSENGRFFLDRDTVKDLFQKNRFVHFFAVRDGSVYEVRGATIHPTADSDRLTAVRGIFIVVKQLGPAVEKRLSTLLSTDVRVETGSFVETDADYAAFPLKDQNGRQIGQVNVFFDALTMKHILKDSEEAEWSVLGAIALNSLALLGVLLFGASRKNQL